MFTKTSSIRHSSSIYNVIPGDFTHDDKLDLLVMSEGTGPSFNTRAIYVSSAVVPVCLTIPPFSVIQPVIDTGRLNAGLGFRFHVGSAYPGRYEWRYED